MVYGAWHPTMSCQPCLSGQDGRFDLLVDGDPMVEAGSRANTQVVILAGGQAQRLGKLGGILPKSLLPVSSTQTLLSRLLDQLIEARFENIVVSTSDVSLPLMRSFVDRYVAWQQTKCSAAASGLVVFNNPEHKSGPLHALAEVLVRFPAHRYLLCLGDIFFTTNPFLQRQGIQDERFDENYLFIWPRPLDECLPTSGTVWVEGLWVKSLSYQGGVDAKGCKYLTASWSGSALFGSSVKEELLTYLRTNRGEILEDFFNYSISLGRTYAGLEVEAFVNINCFEDLRPVLAFAEKDAPACVVTTA